MKGLIRNNIYTIDEILKGVFYLAILALIWILSTYIFFPDSKIFNDIATMAVLGAFSSSCYELLKNETLSKWNKFELTTPISRNDVIKARYITYIIFALIAIAFITITSIIPIFFDDKFIFERFTYNITLLICLFCLSPAMFHPLTLKFGSDKGMFFFIVSTMTSIVFFFAPSLIFLDFFSKFDNPNLVYRVTLSSLSITLFIISYFISKKMYSNKDLQ